MLQILVKSKEKQTQLYKAEGNATDSERSEMVS